MGFGSSLKEEAGSGKVSVYARWAGVLSFFFMIICFIATFSLCNTTGDPLGAVLIGIYGIVVTAVLGFIELPLCFSCFGCCRKIGAMLSCLHSYIVRGIVYIIISIIGFLAHAAPVIFLSPSEAEPNGYATHWSMTILGMIAILAVAILYIVAHFRGERPEEPSEGTDTASLTKAAKTTAVSSAMGIV